MSGLPHAPAHWTCSLTETQAATLAERTAGAGCLRAPSCALTEAAPRGRAGPPAPRARLRLLEPRAVAGKLLDGEAVRVELAQALLGDHLLRLGALLVRQRLRRRRPLLLGPERRADYSHCRPWGGCVTSD